MSTLIKYVALPCTTCAKPTHSTCEVCERPTCDACFAENIGPMDPCHCATCRARLNAEGGCHL